MRTRLRLSGNSARCRHRSAPQYAIFFFADHGGLAADREGWAAVEKRPPEGSRIEARATDS